MADPQKIYRQFLDTLPELARIMAYDFERFQTIRRDTLIGYARTFQKLAEILLTLPCEAQEEAIKVMRDYIASRQREPGHWHDADWLGYMLECVAERAKKRKRRERLKPPADDELPF
ncbi:MAG: hypothetical protein ACO2PP_03015 [Thermocrinis sp.]|jgi:hypothetical protein|uniref:hypothetical protein n=1 Tax=Thermocrinis sp. TaxID=2024383 RepID=UPI003C0E07F0